MYVTEIIESPRSVNVSTNSSAVNFTCIAVADTITFFVNDTGASNDVITGKGFLQNQEVLDHMGQLNRVLTLAVATTDLNNTEIYCQAIGGTPLVVNSTIAVLRIQG